MTLADFLAIAFFWIGAIALPFFMAKVGELKLVPGSNLQPLPEEELQARYEKKFVARQLLRIFLVVFYAGLIVAVITDPPRRIDSTLAPFFTAIGLYSGAMLIAGYLRHRRDSALVATSPALADSVGSFGFRLTTILMGILPLISVGFALQGALDDDQTTTFAGLLVAIAILVLARRFLLAHLIKRQIVVPPDSSLAQKIASTQEKFGVSPKRIAVIPMTMPNAFAMLDGSVLITSTCRAIMSEEEVCAVLAHELSHIRDRDAKNLQRGRALVFLFSGILSGAVSTACIIHTNTPLTTLVGLVILGIAVFTMPIGLLLARVSHRMEFKCDRAAKEIGLGDELASALTKLHQIIGICQRWRWPDTIQLSHPSLERRLNALKQPQ